MKFGYGVINCGVFPGDPRTSADLHREALDLAVHAEDLGFQDVWTTEHHFFPDGYSPNPLLLMAAMAARTTTIRLGSAILLAPLYHPIRLAEDAAVVDLISGGRLTLGIGLGWREEEFEAFGVPKNQRGKFMDDIFTVLRQAWSGELVTGGDTLTFPGVAVRPLPSAPAGPPIWAGGFSERAIRRAARLADGVLPNAPITSDEIVSLQNMAEPEQSLKTMVGWMRDEWAKRDDLTSEPQVSILTSTFAWPGSGEQAWEKVRDYYCYAMWRYADMASARQRSEAPTLPPRMSAEAELAQRSSIIVGNPRQVADRLLRLQDDAGVDLHVIARLYWPGMSYDEKVQAMNVFVEDVIPLTQ